MNDNELMNRRRFFKKTAKEMLPMLGAFVAAPTVIMSTLTSCGCDDCEAACQDDCEGTCSNSCSDSCYDSCLHDCTFGCKDSCSDGCLSSCEGTSTGVPSKGYIDQHEYVDLGLSVLWATKNIGANSEMERGDSFKYVYNNIDDKDEWIRRFNSLSLKDGFSVCGGSLDTAKERWGAKWKLPGKDEFNELKDNCTIEYIESIGVKFTSNINGNSLIIPVQSGSWNGEYANLWSGDYLDYSSEYGFHSAYGLEISYYKDSNSLYVFAGRFGVLRIFTEPDKIEAYQIRPIAERSKGNVSSCNGSCTAHCATGCTSTCKGECSTECKGSCYTDCARACSSGCSTVCTTACAQNCATGCSSGCTTTCADSCKAQTSQYCSNCASNCSSGCTTTCADSCKAQTSQGCNGCSNTCSTGCGRQCYWSCGGSCDKQCEGACITGCQGYNRGSCSGTCFGSCSTQCSSSCRSYCFSSCTNMGVSGT